MAEASRASVLNTRREQTVKVLIKDEKHVLLVQERGTPDDSLELGGNGGKWKKPPGFGLPGGKVEGTLEQIMRGIVQQLQCRGISDEMVNLILKRGKRVGNQCIVMTGVKEVLEEAGVLVMPTKLELWTDDPDKDMVYLMHAKMVAQGNVMSPGDVKIIGTVWQNARQLPRDTYRRTKKMVRRSLEKGGNT